MWNLILQTVKQIVAHPKELNQGEDEALRRAANEYREQDVEHRLACHRQEIGMDKPMIFGNDAAHDCSNAHHMPNETHFDGHHD